MNNGIGSLENDLKQYDVNTFDERLSRLKFVARVMASGAPILTPALAVMYLEDAKICYIFGAFASCIETCQLICEEMLKSRYRFKGDRKAVEMRFSELIPRALKDGLISGRMSSELHKLRLIRNEISHTKDFGRLSEISKSRDEEYKRKIRRLLMSSISQYDLINATAKRAFQIAWSLVRRGAYLAER